MGDVEEQGQLILTIRRGKTVACRRKLQGRNKRPISKAIVCKKICLQSSETVRKKVPGHMIGEIYIVICVLKTSGFLQTTQLNV